MTKSKQNVMWCGLAEGAAIYGFSEARTFVRILKEIPGVLIDERGRYFCSGAVEVLPGEGKYLRVPRDFNPIAVRLLSGIVSSQIAVSPDLGRAYPGIFLKPVLSGAKIEILEDTSGNDTLILQVEYDKVTGRTLIRNN